MSRTKGAQIKEHFAELSDPRRGEVTYPLINVVTMAICAVICGADDFVAIATWAQGKREWLAKFLDLSNGVPSHDRFNAILACLKPGEFEKCLLSWITALHGISDGQIVAIDGKTLRRSYDAASGKAAIHMVSAWATTNHISLGQVVVGAKTNEITAIPKLLEIVEVSGALVTIDAMGCQTEIAETIIAQGADYCLAVKGNQPTLHLGLMDFFERHLDGDFADTPVRRLRTEERGHGRHEVREYFICPVPADLPDRERWKNLKGIGIAISHTQRGGQDSTQVRYYIMSQYMSARRFAEAVRGHWGIENRLHWQLDVTFQEDQCRVRQGHADANLSILRRSALSMLKNETSRKLGIKNKRLAAASDENYLEKVLFGQ